MGLAAGPNRTSQAQTGARVRAVLKRAGGSDGEVLGVGLKLFVEHLAEQQPNPAAAPSPGSGVDATPENQMA